MGSSWSFRTCSLICDFDGHRRDFDSMLTILPPASPPIDTNLPRRERPSSKSVRTDEAEGASVSAKRRTKKTANDEEGDTFNVVLSQMSGKTDSSQSVKVDSSTDAVGSMDVAAEGPGVSVTEPAFQASSVASVNDVGSGVDSKILLPKPEVKLATADVDESQSQNQTQNLVNGNLTHQAATLLQPLDANVQQSLDEMSLPKTQVAETQSFQTPVLAELVSAKTLATTPPTNQQPAVVQLAIAAASANSAKTVEAAEDASLASTANVAIKPPLVEESRKPSDSEESTVSSSADSGTRPDTLSVAVPVSAVSATETLASSTTTNDQSHVVQSRSATRAQNAQQPAFEQSPFDALEQFWSQHTKSSSNSEQDLASVITASETSKAIPQTSTSQVAQMPTNEPLTNVSMATIDLSTAITTEQRQPLSSQVTNAILDQLARQPDRNQDSITIKLDPPDLGEMTIELSRTNDGLAVRVTAREAVTMDMLFSRGDEIESHLRDQNLDLKSLEFLAPRMTNGGDSQGQQQSRETDNESPSGSLQRMGRRLVANSATPRSTQTASDSNHALTFRA